MLFSWFVFQPLSGWCFTQYVVKCFRSSRTRAKSRWANHRSGPKSSPKPRQWFCSRAESNWWVIGYWSITWLGLWRCIYVIMVTKTHLSSFLVPRVRGHQDLTMHHELRTGLERHTTCWHTRTHTDKQTGFIIKVKTAKTVSLLTSLVLKSLNQFF